MCGIFGLAEPATEARHRVLARMGKVLTHRGPDGHGTFENERIALGARRLAINDVAHGRQPVANESGEIVAVTFGARVTVPVGPSSR